MKKFQLQIIFTAFIITIQLKGVVPDCPSFETRSGYSKELCFSGTATVADYETARAVCESYCGRLFTELNSNDFTNFAGQYYAWNLFFC